jgi:hypothetical protein
MSKDRRKNINSQNNFRKKYNRDIKEKNKRAKRHSVRNILRSYEDVDNEELYEDEYLKKNSNQKEKSE